MTRTWLSLFLCAAAIGGCSEVPDRGEPGEPGESARVVVSADGEHVLSIDPELHRQREARRMEQARPRATPREQVAELGATGGTVLVVRTTSTTTEFRDTIVEGNVEGEMFVIAEVEVERVVRGTAPARSRLTVEARVSSALAHLVPGQRNLVELAPDGGSDRPRLRSSYQIVDDALPEIGQSLGDAVAAIAEVRHAN